MPAPQHREGVWRRRARAMLLAAATITLASTAGIFAPAAVAASDPIVSLTAPASARVGDTVTVSVPVDAVADLYAYELSLDFDPALLAYKDGSAVLPSGGYSSVSSSSGRVTLTHTRLGTSPGLVGAQTLATAAFTVLAGGQTAALTPAAVTFVASDGSTSNIIPPPAAVIAIEAVPVVEPSPEPRPSASSSAPSPSLAASGSDSSDPLASTGGAALPVMVGGAFAVALVALGTILIIRRARTKESLQ